MKNHQESPEDVVLLSHGAGGVLQEQLIKFLTLNAKIRRVDQGIGIDEFDDGATIPLQDSDLEIVVTSDGHTIHPLVFPGGDIGLLSAASTINDLAMMGARCIAISSTVFIEEGFSFRNLRTIMDSFTSALEKHSVALICGDTKVLPKGQLDQLMMSTTGIGLRPKTRLIADNNVQPGDSIIVTGPLGDHEAALIANRHGINLKTALNSDVTILLDLIEHLHNFTGIHAMKDPTRGGIASALNQWATQSKVGILLTEKEIRIRPEVRSICDILGLNPYHLASEGKAILAVDPDYTDIIIEKLREHPLGKDAKIVGVAQRENLGMVLLQSEWGGTKFLDTPYGEPIPRVC
ncbi:MAG: hydrogenase expression/formation protein HypE [Candidatus Lokiarchaeota archaeon]|nr:hydrogenase expression/formation protein HypE [Candidatus Lokiarchaeota archaeon]